MSDLQCAATFLLVPHGAVAGLAPMLAGARVAHVWTAPGDEVQPAADRLAADLGVGLTGRGDLGVPALLESVLADLADEHRGETVVVVVEGGDDDHEVVEVAIDGDGITRRSWSFGP